MTNENANEFVHMPLQHLLFCKLFPLNKLSCLKHQRRVDTKNEISNIKLTNFSISTINRRPTQTSFGIKIHCASRLKKLIIGSTSENFEIHIVAQQNIIFNVTGQQIYYIFECDYDSTPQNKFILRLYNLVTSFVINICIKLFNFTIQSVSSFLKKVKIENPKISLFALFCILRNICNLNTPLLIHQHHTIYLKHL